MAKRTTTIQFRGLERKRRPRLANCRRSSQASSAYSSRKDIVVVRRGQSKECIFQGGIACGFRTTSQLFQGSDCDDSAPVENRDAMAHFLDEPERMGAYDERSTRGDPLADPVLHDPNALWVDPNQGLIQHDKGRAPEHRHSEVDLLLLTFRELVT